MNIDIKLFDNRNVECSTLIIGKTYENEATILHFDITEEMANKDVYIDFEKPDGNKISTSKLEVITEPNDEIGGFVNFVEYSIPNYLLDIKGDLKTEVIFRKDGLVFKTFTIKFTILESINASEEIPNKYPDFVSEAQKVIDLFEMTGDGTKYLSNDGTYKEVKSGSNDYNELTNKPFIKLVGTEENVISLRDLSTGGYVLDGTCTPYVGSNAYMVANNAITFVNHFETVTAIQIFYPPYNQVQYFEVYDDNYTSNIVRLNDLPTKEYVDGLLGDVETLLGGI